MDFIKKHYEKILLGLVLLGLAVAVALLPLKVQHEKEKLEKKRNEVINVSVKPLPPLDDTLYNAAYQKLESPPVLNFSRPHNLFNPVPWQKKADGSLIKVQTGSEIGPEAVTVVKINPLFTTITLEQVGASGTNYQIGVTRDADPNPAKRRKKSSLFEVGTKSDFLTLQEVKGTPDKPELILVLADTGEKISVTADKPYQRPDGYTADLKYDPEKLVRVGLRVGARLTFAGDEFSIASINLIATNQFEVILSAKSTGKKTTVRYGSSM